MVQLTREEYNIFAKSRGIMDLQKMSTKELLNTLNRYDSRCKVKNNRRKLSKIGLEKIAKIQNISKNELNQAQKLQQKSIDELKGIARLRRIKNIEELTKEDLIITCLKSKNSDTEHSYVKFFNAKANDNDNDDTYDDKIRGKIRDIKIIFNRLRNIVTNKDRKKITKELHEIEKMQNLSDNEKEEIYDHLIKLVNSLNKKEKYQYHDRDDLDYYGIKDIENLFSNVDDIDDDYYKPILIKRSFKNNYKYYESKGDKDKELSVKQYLYMIMPYLRDLTNNNKSNEWKIQINMHVNFISSKDTGEARTIYIWSDNEEIRLGNETDDIVKELFKSFLNNYQ